MTVTTDNDLLAYLVAYGVDGAPTEPGWHVVQIGEACYVAQAVRAYRGGVDIYIPGDEVDMAPERITRHAPLRLAQMQDVVDAAREAVGWSAGCDIEEEMGNLQGALDRGGWPRLR